MASSETQTALTLKIFVGFTLSSELKMHLNHSIAWKHAQIQKEQVLEEVHFHHKVYIGSYLDDKPLTLNYIRQIEASLRQKLASYCPFAGVEQLPICIFPQVFIA